MALFDDPKKELRRLQEQLLAEEEEYQEEEVLEELLEEYSEEAALEELFEGDSFFFEANTEHRFMNNSQTECHYFLVIDSTQAKK